MYYQSRTHEIVEAKDVIDAAEKIKSGIAPYQVVSWVSTDNQYKMFAVPDGHLDNPLLELAILRKKISVSDSNYEQVESITNGWIKSAYVLATYLQESEQSPLIMDSNAQLIIGKPQGHETAHFTCGCCGTWFEGNVKYQLQFDQDASYGICKDCEHYYK